MIRLLHTADWQLGKTFGWMPAAKRPILWEARFEAVRTIAGLATSHGVDAVLVAGDVFDQPAVTPQTSARALDAMRGFAGPWVLMPGNHDAGRDAGVWSRIVHDGVPENVRLALMPEPITLADGRLVVLPAPLAARHTSDDPSGWMDAAPSPAGAVRVGLAHGGVAGLLPEPGEATNPIAADRAATARLDYLALGDWHGCREIDPRTWYAGTPEPDRFPRNEPGWALLVEIDGPGAPPRVSRLPVARHHWASVDLDLDRVEAERITERLDVALDRLPVPERAVVQLRLHGCISLAARAALDRALETIDGRLGHLEVDDEGLSIEPDAADLMLLDAAPATAEVARRLAARDDPVARLALRHLHRLARYG